jgi:hypothetical protein
MFVALHVCIGLACGGSGDAEKKTLALRAE